MTDREVLARAKKDARKIRDFLTLVGFVDCKLFDNDNGLNPGYIVEGAANDGSGYTINVEVIGSPWEDDGTAKS